MDMEEKNLELQKIHLDLQKILGNMRKKAKEEWERKTPQEKLEEYRKDALYYRYCDMSIEELEKEKKFNQYMINKLQHSIFHDIYYSVEGCEKNIKRINTILELKEMNK